MLQAKSDLILDSLETPRKITLDIGAITPGKLTLLEALDIADASGVDADGFGAALRGPQTRRQGLLVYAMAWVLARRREPDLTFAEVCTYQIELLGQGATQAQLEAEVKRATTIAAVGMLAGVTPDEAEQMTVAEVSAVTSIVKARRRRR